MTESFGAAAASGSPVTVEDGAWLDRAEEAWTELLDDSDADPLFMSWLWTSSWWKFFGPVVEGSPHILLARDGDGRLVGIAPFYTKRRTRAVAGRTLVAMGNAWRRELGVMSEHVTWICRRGAERSAAHGIVNTICRNSSWDEASFKLADRDGVMCRSLEEVARREDWYVRIEGEIDWYWVDTSGSFADYIAGLRPGVRTKLFNRRKRLARTGRVEIRYADPSTVEQFLDVLCKLHYLRWQISVPDTARQFLSCICNAFVRSDRLRLSQLTVDGSPISSILALVADNREYNIQSAFDPGVSGLSPGMLHLGFELERAFEQRAIEKYDLLAGGGKSTPFKQGLASSSGVFRSLQIVRNPMLAMFYRTYDRLRR